MAKLKQPLLSLGAAGTLGGVLTFTKPDSKGRVRRKPIPTYTNTLVQQYQRWDYQDAVHFWYSLTPAQKTAFRPTASRFHMTTFAAVVRYYLRNLPDLLARWRLDRPMIATTPDSSKNTNTGTVFGCSPASGIIGDAFYFDGINDSVHFPTPINSPSGNWTLIEHYKTYPGFTVDLPAISDVHCANSRNNNGGFSVVLFGGFVRPTIESLAGHNVIQWACPWGDDEWHTISVTYDGTTYKLFTDGVFRGQVVFAWQPAQFNFRLGVRNDGWGSLKGTLDNVCYYNRVLSDAQILQHSRRRYPV